MSFNKYLGKAKAKAEEFAKQHNIPIPTNLGSSSGPQSGYPGAQPSQGQPQYNNHQPQYNNYPPQYNNYQPQYHNQPPPIPPNHPSTQSFGTSAPQAQPYWLPSFNPATPVSGNFKHQTGAHGWGNNELQNYVPAPENSFYTPDGKLIVRAIARNGQFTSARLTSHMPLSKQRGSLVAVATPPCAPGIWPALWLLPTEPFQWPNEAEIDILETWNADGVNHTCLHWGHFNGEDWNKHRVVETNVENMANRPIRYEFVWEQDESKGRNDGGGRAVWYIDGRAVMKAEIPQGARRMSDWQVIINVAMGGNVCQGKTPADGHYDLIVHELKLADEPTGGVGAV